MTSAVPAVNRLIIEALVETYASRMSHRRLLLVRGRYADNAPDVFTVRFGDTAWRVHVSQQNSVLGVVDAWRRHRDGAGKDGDVLVVTSGVDDRQLGWDIKGHAVNETVLSVENAEIVKQRFGAKDLDPRMYRESWLLEALLDAEQSSGWPRTGTVLTRDAAVRALVVARLGLTDVTIDADALLAWSRDPAGLIRFTELGQHERAELVRWLAETTGPAIPVLMSLVEAGHGDDAMSRGLLGAAMAAPATGPDIVLAVGGLFGRVRRTDVLAFSDTVAGALTRWIGEARQNDTARRRVLDIVDRADQLAKDTGLSEALRTSPFLPSSFTAQLHSLAAELERSPEHAEAVLAELRGHALAPLSGDRLVVAEMAVRTSRWLTETQPRVNSVAQGVTAHFGDWGWADRALNVVWSGDPAGDPVVDKAYRALYEVARTRRDGLDEQFATRLAAWSRTADAHHPGGCLLVENVLNDVALPLLDRGRPMILVLDGMSSAAALQIGEEAEREGWIEAVPRPATDGRAVRQAAVSMLPSVTRISRTSLLTGDAAIGGQSTEESGFTAFWKQHHAEAKLFHKASIGGPSGQRLAEELVTTLATDTVVGVVLNTIDDALDHGQQGERTQWRIGDVTYLRELLSAAQAYGRPVVLVSDHGYVLERGAGGATPTTDAPSSRWRTGRAAEEGEIELNGPRVLEGGGSIIAPWREDIRYSPRKAGYHGGASLAEVTVPLLTLLPSLDCLPKQWQVLPREQMAPSWWTGPRTAAGGGQMATSPVLEVPARRKTTRKPSQPPSGDGLFPAAEIAAAEARKTGQQAAALPAEPATLGGEVVASDVYRAQKVYVRKAPDAKVVAAVIDILADAGEKMSPAALASAIPATDRVKRNIDGFVATVQRLLNVEGYPVLAVIESGHTVRLDIQLLRTQFQLEGARS